MESDTSPAQTITDVERERLRPYLTDTTPPWFGPAFGVAVAIFVASHDVDNLAIRVVMIVLYCVAVGALVGLKVRRNGFQPRMNGMPRPLVKQVVVGAVVLGAIAAAAVPIAMLSSFRFRFTIAGIVLGLTTWAWLHVFTAKYERLTEQLAAEAGIELP